MARDEMVQATAKGSSDHKAMLEEKSQRKQRITYETAWSAYSRMDPFQRPCIEEDHEGHQRGGANDGSCHENNKSY